MGDAKGGEGRAGKAGEPWRTGSAGAENVRSQGRRCAEMEGREARPCLLARIPSLPAPRSDALGSRPDPPPQAPQEAEQQGAPGQPPHHVPARVAREDAAGADRRLAGRDVGVDEHAAAAARLRRSAVVTNSQILKGGVAPIPHLNSRRRIPPQVTALQSPSGAPSKEEGSHVLAVVNPAAPSRRGKQAPVQKKKKNRKQEP